MVDIRERIKTSYKDNDYAIVGVGGDIKDWMTLYERILIREGGIPPLRWTIFFGHELNDHFNLKDKFDDNTRVLCFSTKHISIDILRRLMGSDIDKKVKYCVDVWFKDEMDKRLKAVK